jgi:hypothetical protein
MWLVQKAASNGKEWTTLYRTENETTAREGFDKTIRVYNTGKFRLLDPTGKTITLKFARDLFTAA